MADLDILTRWAARCATSRNRVIRDAPWTLREVHTVSETIAILREHVAERSRPIENLGTFSLAKLKRLKQTTIALAREADWLESEGKRD